MTATEAETRRNRALMQRFAKAFGTGDIDGVLACVSPRFEWRLPDGQTAKGKPAVRAVLEARIGAKSGPRFRNSKFRYLGDTVIQTYDVSIKDARGKIKKTNGLDVYKLSNGLILKKDAYWKGFAG